MIKPFPAVATGTAGIVLALTLSAKAHAVDASATGPALYRCSTPYADIIDTSPADSLTDAKILYANWVGVHATIVRCRPVGY